MPDRELGPRLLTPWSIFLQGHPLPVLSWSGRPCLKQLMVQPTGGRSDRQRRQVMELSVGGSQPPVLSGLPTAVANSCCALDFSEHVFAGPAWTCPSSAACRSTAWSPCYGLIPCTVLANQRSVATLPPRAQPFSPVAVTASIAVHRHLFAIFVWIDFLKAPDAYLSSYFPPSFLTPFNLHLKLSFPPPAHIHRNQTQNH